MKTDQVRMENEFEMFLRDVEEDEELRATLALYKNAKKDDAMSIADTGSEGEIPRINVDELLEDLEDLDIQDDMQEG